MILHLKTVAMIMLLCVSMIYEVTILLFPFCFVADSELELVAPAIVIPPRNTTVVVGTEATLECVANAR